MFNTVMILIILSAAIAGLVYFVRRTTQIDDGLDVKEITTIDTLISTINETFSATIKRSVSDMNLSSSQYKKAMANKEELKNAINMCSRGDSAAKQFVMQYIEDIITDTKIGKVSPLNIDTIIPFEDPDRLKSRYKFEILTMLWLNEGEREFSRHFSSPSKNNPDDPTAYGLDRPKKTRYGDVYDVTEEDISYVYADFMKRRGGLSYLEKVAFLAQVIYEQRFGIGPVDLLDETEIDEYQGGTSGIPAGKFDIKTKEVTYSDESAVSDYEKSLDQPRYSFEAVWIVFHGLNIHLSCTSFETQKELQRVTRNIYRYNAPTILTQKDPAIIAARKDGSRVAVMCPDFSDSYAFICRKFDSTPSYEPETLI